MESKQKSYKAHPPMAWPTREFCSLASGGAGTVTDAETNSIDVTVDLGFGEDVVFGGGGDALVVTHITDVTVDLGFGEDVGVGGGVLFVDVADVVCLEDVVEDATVLDSLDVVALEFVVADNMVVDALKVVI